MSVWHPSGTAVNGQYSVSPGNLVLAEHKRCADLWVIDDEPVHIEGAFPAPVDRRALPRLSVDDLRQSSLANAVSKTVTYDGIHPRHIGLLCDDGIEPVGAIWEACELAAELPPQVDLAMAPLLPKKGPGYRDIALFAGMVRVCTRARVPYCKRWEADNDRAYFAAGSLRSAPDVVWRTAVSCEAAASSKQPCAAVLWDMKSFFQMLRHRRLLLRAEAANFPMVLARLAVRLYRAPRRLSLGKLVGPEKVTPSRGVAPG
eukprot:12414827-Karenia_brevis.AAC.1